MKTILENLRRNRRAVDALKASIKTVEAPFLAQAAAASGALRATLAEYEARTDASNDEAKARYTALEQARYAALVQGREVAGVALPPGWSVQHRAKAEIFDEAAVPRDLCKPDARAVGAALKKRAEVPGARLNLVPTFVFRGTPDEGV